TILTFFPWGNQMTRGRRGTRQVTEIGYSVPDKSLDFWLQRFEQNNIIYNKIAEKFGEQYLTFLDPDGLKFELTVPLTPDSRKPWTTENVAADQAIRGFHHITITTNKIDATTKILVDVLGYQLKEQEVNRYRFMTDAVKHAAFV